MSEMKLSDLHYPGGRKNRETILRHTAQWARSEQTVAASLATDPLRGANPIEQPDRSGTLHLSFLSSKPAAAGESMTVDVLKNGTSVLTAPFVYNTANSPASPTQISMDGLIIAGTTVKTGDVLVTTRTYVAGGATMTNNAVRAEWSAGENG